MRAACDLGPPLREVASLVQMDYRERLTINPSKRSGRPCIRNSRMTVYDVLEYLEQESGAEALLSDFPDLTPEDVDACLAFAASRDRKQVTVERP